MRLSKLLASTCIVCGACLAGAYGEGSLFVVIQMISASLIILAGFTALLSSEAKRIPLQPFEKLMGSIFLFSTIVALIRGDTMSTVYGILFLTFLTSISMTTRMLTESEILKLFRIAFVILLVAVVTFQGGAFLTSVSGGVERTVGLIRFEPLGLHPNLTGLVYGGGGILFFGRMLQEKKLSSKLICFILGFVCFSIILAASARASVLALFISSLIGVTLALMRATQKIRIVFLLLVFCVIVFTLLNAQQIIAYLTLIFDLESDTRGVDSGATGRTTIWREGILLAFSDPVLLLTGRGTRGATVAAIGFPVESSYINLLLEYGLILSVAIVLKIAGMTTRFMRRSEEYSVQSLIFGVIFLFVLLQSVFNRYLIAIGNIFSIMFIFIAVSSEISLFLKNQNKKQAFAFR